MWKLLRKLFLPPVSHHSVYVIVDGLKYRIVDNYGLKLQCTKARGWTLWDYDDKFIGGEYESAEFIVMVDEKVVCRKWKG